MEILDHYSIDCQGKHAVVIGRSLVVGKPVAMMLLQRNATVTVCHTKTADLPAVTRQADLLVTAAGALHSLGKAHVRPGQIVLDVSINWSEEKGGIAILRGNLAPGGAVIKRSAASPSLMKHRGRAKVFEDLKECQRYLLDDSSDMTADTVIILRGYGPVGAPGMPENGNYMPLPPKLKRMGINDFVRRTDSRMSGGCFGTQVLHVSPESAVGGPLAAVRDGDFIKLDVEAGLIEVELSDAEISARLAEFKPETHPEIKRGFVRNFIDNVTQADEGCDMKYLQYKE